MLRQGVAASEILAVTFTNKAATEMRERIQQMIPKDKAKEMTVCTFHSLCVRILRKDIERIGYKKNFTIYTASDQVGLVRKLISRHSAKDEAWIIISPSHLLVEVKTRGFQCRLLMVV